MRKNNNQYLERINESVTGQTVDVRRTNNWYLRSIAKNTSSEEIHGHRTDNYYLRRIALNMEEIEQTIAELRGEVEELEELLANDIHLFSCCKDIVQTGESLGLFAYCKHDGEVEGNTVYFYVVEPPIDDIIVKFTGTSFSSVSPNPFVGENIVIDWGDGTTTNYTTGSDFNHTYSENTEHTIRISNITGIANDGVFRTLNITEAFIPSNVLVLGDGAFNQCRSLTSVTLSEGLTTIGASCLTTCDSLTEITIPKSVTSIGVSFCGGTPIENINLLWDTSESIIEYDMLIFDSTIGDYTFTIPTGTTSLYEAKGYPSDKLQER